MSNIVIVVRGGIIQDIYRDSKEAIDVCVLDYDVENSDALIIKTHEGDETRCNIYKDVATEDKDLVNHYFKELNGEK